MPTRLGRREFLARAAKWGAVASAASIMSRGRAAAASEAEVVSRLQANGTLIKASNWNAFAGQGGNFQVVDGWSSSGSSGHVEAGVGPDGSAAWHRIIPSGNVPSGNTPGDTFFDISAGAWWPGQVNWRKYVKFTGPYDFYWVNPPGQMQKLSYVDINQSPYNRILCGVRALQGTGIAPNDRAHGIFGFDYIQHKANIFGVVPTTWDDGSAIGASIPSGEPDVLVIVNDSQWYCLEIEVSITSATVNRVRIYVDGVRILSRQNANMTQFMNAGSKGGVYQDAVSWGGSTGDGPLRDIHIFTDNYIVAREYIGPNGVAGQGPASPSGLNLS